MRQPGQHSETAVAVPSGAWYGDRALEVTFPPGWEVHLMAPADAPAMDDAAIDRALAAPVGTPRLRDLAAGKRSAIIAIDDLTRPTPVHRFLPQLIGELTAGGIAESRIGLLMGTAAHRPLAADEVARKLGPSVAARFTPILHDFMGPDIRRVGWVLGGPVHLNRHFLDADLRIVVGGVIPHAETGFGGGAKMVVPGLSGHLTIAHFHGALPPRPAGQLESTERLDRRAWAEAVARHVGVDAAVCAVVNSRRELAGLYVGDVVQAHRTAARQARAIGRTDVPRNLAENTDVIVVNAYPLDTDPVQMGKSLAVGTKLAAPLMVLINSASDGIMYHGMGMGCGVEWGRLLRNVPGWLASPRRMGTWLRGMVTAIRSPILAARFCYFTMNGLPYETFKKRTADLGPESEARPTEHGEGNPLVWSPTIPRWGFRRKHPHGRLYREWAPLVAEVGRRFKKPRVLVFPCAPMQLVEVL
jgi:nickel-dependent lactate racemase